MKSLLKLDDRQVNCRIIHPKVSCSEIVLNSLNRINEGAQLNAFISVLGENARQQADIVDNKIKQGQAGELAGFVLAVKDNIPVKNARTTCGSKILSDFIAPYQATVIDRLIAADAIIIGKTNMDEFAMGSSNENSYFGPVKNPHDVSRVAGGSSGGSAAAVAAGLARAALGSDTGGSIRQPAAFCGVVGLKPTYGRVSRFGLVAFASSFDQIGPIARTVDDCARVYQIIAGYDPHDFTSVNIPVTEYIPASNPAIKDLTVGLPHEFFTAGLAPEIHAAVDNAVKMLSGAGALVIDISLPHTPYAIATYYILANAEASANLARFDGVRFGFRANDVDRLEEMYVQTRTQGFGEEVKRRIILGTYTLSAGYYEAYYRKAQQVRTLIQQDFNEAFQKCDCLITPTTPTTAFKIGEKIDDPLAMYLSDIYTVPANLAGIPALSLPCGRDSNRLPIGLQIMAKPFAEAILFRVASFLEKILLFEEGR